MLYYGIGIERVLARLFSYVLPTSPEVADTVRLIIDIVSAGQTRFYPNAEDVIQDMAGTYEIYSTKIKLGEATIVRYIQDIGRHLEKMPRIEQRAIRL
jgi:hypothetical protein